VSSGNPVRDGADATPAAALDGNLDERLEALRRRLTAAVRRVCPPWLARDSEDIAQNVLVQLSRAGLLGEGEQGPSSMYLQRAAHGATVDEIRRRCRRREVQLPEAESLAELAPSAAADPEHEAASAEIGRGIQGCLPALARPRRLAVTLYLQGCSVPETARRLGWPAKRTENLVYRGLADLRRCLVAKGLTP
jgi:RNA polymerase sigma-70 factor (ECF subfamily)